MPITALRPASPAQVNFINSLRSQRALAALSDDELLVLDTRAASREIDRLKALPIVARTRPANAGAMATLPLCKYIVTGDAGQRVHLEVVERRNGRRFVNVLVGAPGDWRRQNVAYATQVTLAEKIHSATYRDEIGQRDLTGPEAAAVRFSREHKCCAACLSPLSDESQPGYRVGLGPVCRTRFGY